MLHWFYELGFNVGVPVLVKCEKGKLIIMANTAMAVSYTHLAAGGAAQSKEEPV